MYGQKGDSAQFEQKNSSSGRALKLPSLISMIISFRYSSVLLIYSSSVFLSLFVGIQFMLIYFRE